MPLGRTAPETCCTSTQLLLLAEQLPGEESGRPWHSCGRKAWHDDGERWNCPPQSRFVYHAKVAAGEAALLEWTARVDNGSRVDDGVDSFVIRNGRIQAQTIHYTIGSSSGHGAGSVG